MSVLLQLLLFTSPVATAASLELSPGDDLASLTASLQPGDELVFTHGTYVLEERLSWTGQGTEAEPIVLRAADGATPVLELSAGEDGDYPSGIVRISESAWLEVRGLHLRGDAGWADPEDRFSGLELADSSDVLLSDLRVGQTSGTALDVSGDSARITIRDTEVHDVLDGDGVDVGCGDGGCSVTELVLERLWIHDLLGPDDNGLALRHGTQGAVVVDTVVHDVGGRGVYLGSTDRGEANAFEGGAVWATGLEGVRVQGAARVRNSLVFLTGEEGIEVDDPGRDAYGDVVLAFNTVVDTADWAVQIEDQLGRSGMILSGNALCNPLGLGLSLDATSPEDPADTGFVPEHDVWVQGNVVCGYVEGVTEEELTAGQGWQDYLDVAGWDLYPQDGGALVGGGSVGAEAWVPEVDFNGLPRDGTGPDAGAYEWSGADNPGWQVQEGFKGPPATATDATDVGGCGCGGGGKDGGDKDGDEGAAAAGLLLLSLVGLRRRRRR